MEDESYLNNCDNFGINIFRKRKLKINDKFSKKFDGESSKKMKMEHSSTIELLFSRFPTLEKKICNELEMKSLIEFTGASKQMINIRLNSKFYWVRCLQNELGKLYVGKEEKIPKDWSKVIARCPMEIIKELLAVVAEFYSSSPKNKICIVKSSPMHIAAERGNLALCRHIVGRIEDKNPKDLFGQTPLHWAAEQGHYQVCKLILENVSDKNPKDHEGVTPFHAAVLSGHFYLCKLIIQNIDNKSPRENFGLTPLHWAALTGNLNMCRLIIENVKDVNPRDFFGKRPLHVAAMRGHFDVCKLFIEKIKDTIPRDHIGPSPLVSEDYDGCTPLHDAARSGHLAIFKLIESAQ